MRVREWPLLFAIFLDLVGFGMAFPDVQLRAEAFGAPGWLIGAVLSSYFIVQFVVSPRWGALSDHIGRKPVLLVCTALSALSMLVYAFAGSVWLILLSRVLAGLAAANVIVGQAYLADITPEDERKAAMGRVSGAVLLGLIAGPAIGGELAARGGNYLMGITAASASTLSLLWILVGVKAMPPASERRPGARDPFGLKLLKESPQLARLFGVYVAGWFSLACLEGTFGRLIERLFGYGQREFGYIFGFESLLGALTGFFLVWLTRRLSEAATLRAGYVLQGIGLGMNPLAPWIAGWLVAAGLPHAMAPGFVALLLASVLYSLGSGVTNPTLMALASKSVNAERQGELFGLLQVARAAGFFIGPVLGGMLFDLAPAAPYVLACAVSLLAAASVRRPAPAQAPT